MTTPAADSTNPIKVVGEGVRDWVIEGVGLGVCVLVDSGVGDTVREDIVLVVGV